MSLITCILISLIVMNPSEMQADTLKMNPIQIENFNQFAKEINSIYSTELICVNDKTDMSKYKLIFGKGIRFKIGESKIDFYTKDALTKFAEILIKYPTVKVSLIGHTDSTGPFELNQTLSTERAQTVADYLIEHNVSINQLPEIIGKNFSEPLADNSTASGRAANRCVEVFLQIAHPTTGYNIYEKDTIQTKPATPALKKIVDQVLSKAKDKNEYDLEIDGLVVDDTKTRSGKDFYDLFYSSWLAPPSAKNYSIIISEKPYRMNYTMILVSINENIVYQSVLQPRQDIIEALSDDAIAYTQNYLENYEEIMDMINGEDLTGSGIY